MSARDVGSVPCRRGLAGIFSTFQEKLERREKRQAARAKTRPDEAESTERPHDMLKNALPSA